MSTILETTLVRTPGVCGGKLCIEGTRQTVNQLVMMHNQGMTPEQILEQYPHRALREIYAVLAWYHDHREEFDAELAAENAADQAAIDAHLAAQRQ